MPIFMIKTKHVGDFVIEKKRLQFQRENDNNPQDFGMGHVIENPISELWDAPGLDTPILYILSQLYGYQKRPKFRPNRLKMFTLFK